MPVPNGNRHKLILHDYKRIEDEEVTMLVLMNGYKIYRL